MHLDSIIPYKFFIIFNYNLPLNYRKIIYLLIKFIVDFSVNNNLTHEIRNNTMPNKELDIINQLCEVIEESEKMSIEVMDHLDVVLEKLNNLINSKDLAMDIDGIKNNIFMTLESMQAQDAHRQKIERVVNNIDPENGKFANSAKHITGDNDSDLVDEDELAALIAAANS